MEMFFGHLVIGRRGPGSHLELTWRWSGPEFDKNPSIRDDIAFITKLHTKTKMA